jgi:hypothetical protein
MDPRAGVEDVEDRILDPTGTRTPSLQSSKLYPVDSAIPAFFDDLVVMNVMVTVVSDWYYVVGRQEKPAASIFRVEAILVL